MGIVTTYPDTMIAQSGTTVTDPPNNRIAALSDEKNSTWVTFHHGDHPFMEFAEPSIPSGAKVKAARLWATAKKSASGDALVFNPRMYDPASGSNIFAFKQDVPIPSTTATRFRLLEDERKGPHVTPTNILVDIYAHGSGSSPSVAVFALEFETIYVAKPVTTVTFPSGTITGDTTPAIDWSVVRDPDGGNTTHFHVRIFTAAQYGIGGFNPATSPSTQDSGETPRGTGGDNWTPALLIDGTYRAYVRVAQTVNGELLWSDWAYSQFTMSINRPAVPTFALTSEPTYGRIKVVATSVAGDATTSLVQVQVSDDGTTWEDLRGGFLTPSGGTSTGYDYEAPNGGTRSFRVRALHTYPEGYAVSAWAATQTSSWESEEFWIKSVDHPTLSLAVVPKSQPSATRAASMGTFKPLGARYPIAVTDPRSSASGEFVWLLDSDTIRDAFEALLASGGIVLIQAPAGVQDWPDRYCAIGDHSRERALDTPWTTYSYDSIQWTEVARP